MSRRSSSRRAAIPLARLTNWTLATCIDLIRCYSADVIEQLAKLRGRPIDTASEDYARWRRRAQWHRRTEGMARS